MRNFSLFMFYVHFSDSFWVVHDEWKKKCLVQKRCYCFLQDILILILSSLLYMKFHPVSVILTLTCNNQAFKWD